MDLGALNENFTARIIGFPAKLALLLEKDPISRHPFRKDSPRSGVYLFTDNHIHLYAGRSRNIRSRYGLHTRPSATHNQANFAFLLAKEALHNSGTFPELDEFSRTKLQINPKFKDEFFKAKCRVKRMDFRWIEESDDTTQALLEIYCSITLKTPYNKFRTH